MKKLFSPSARKWWVLAAGSASLAMVFLDHSAVPVALPSIQRELGLTTDLLQWVMNAYVLALAVLIILGGKLGDKFGHRRIFLYGMIIFIISSVLCAAAPGGMWLIASRVLQGVGGALMIPTVSPLMRATMGNAEFNKMVGFYVSIASVFLVLGPTLGGFLTTYLSWRWIFWINFPIALMAILITIYIIPEDVMSKIREKGFDWLGFFTLSLSLICLVFALMQGETLGWGSVTILGCLGISLLALAIFISIQRHHPAPFVDLSLFKNGCISRCVIVIGLIQIAYMSIIFWAMFLQYAFMLSAVQAGFFLLAAQVPVIFSSPLAGKMLNHYGPRKPVALGALLIAISTAWIGVVAGENSSWWLLPALIIFGIGSPMVSIGVMSTVISVAPEEKRGVTTGVVSAARQIGGAVGLAILAALVLSISMGDMYQWLQSTTGALAQLTVHQLNELLNGTPLPASLNLTVEEIVTANDIAVNAYTHGFSYAMFFVALVSFFGFFIAVKLPNQPVNTN